MNMEALRGEMKVVLVYIKDTQGLKSYSSSMVNQRLKYPVLVIMQHTVLILMKCMKEKISTILLK